MWEQMIFISANRWFISPKWYLLASNVWGKWLELVFRTIHFTVMPGIYSITPVWSIRIVALHYEVIITIGGGRFGKIKAKNFNFPFVVVFPYFGWICFGYKAGRSENHINHSPVSFPSFFITGKKEVCIIQPTIINPD